MVLRRRTLSRAGAPVGRHAGSQSIVPARLNGKGSSREQCRIIASVFLGDADLDVRHLRFGQLKLGRGLGPKFEETCERRIDLV